MDSLQCCDGFKSSNLPLPERYRQREDWWVTGTNKGELDKELKKKKDDRTHINGM